MRFAVITLMVFSLSLPLVAQVEPNAETSLVIDGFLSLDNGERLPEARLEFIVSYAAPEGVEPPAPDIVGVTTDENGHYYAEIDMEENWNNVSLVIRGHNNDLFRYPPPDPINLTNIVADQLKAGDRLVRFSYRMSSRPGWQEERQKLNLYGEESDKGRLILIRGLPDRVKKFSSGDDEDGELWFYYEDGIVIRFIKDKRDRDFYFKPVTAAESRNKDGR